MKARILFLIFSLFACSAIGQNDSISADTIRHGHKNVVKFLPVNLIFNSASFELERKISPKNSLILGVGIPMPKAFADKYSLGSPENRITDDSFGTMAIRLAYRHYAGHSNQPSGFYISPYLKYQSFSASATNHKTPTSGSPYVENYDFTGNTMSIGFQIGWQFLIAKTVSIDFFFLGIEAGLANVDATVKSPDANMIDDIYTNVSQNIGDLPSFLSNKISVKKTGTNQVDIVGSSMPYPWLRSGISIGIAF